METTAYVPDSLLEETKKKKTYWGCDTKNCPMFGCPRHRNRRTCDWCECKLKELKE